MASLPERILALLHRAPGLTDRQITNELSGHSAPQQPVNIAARSLAQRGRIVRAKRDDGLIGNYLATSSSVSEAPQKRQKPGDPMTRESLSEDTLKRALWRWLSTEGWSSEIAWGRKHGVDILAQRGAATWIIEVKGHGSLSPMRVNYFLGILGETLQRMNDPAAKYSIALPDVPQFRGLWERLPRLAKERTQITMLFVTADGIVTELPE